MANSNRSNRMEVPEAKAAMHDPKKIIHDILENFRTFP